MKIINVAADIHARQMADHKGLQLRITGGSVMKRLSDSTVLNFLISVIFICLVSMAMIGCAVKSSGRQIKFSSSYEEKQVGWAMPTEMEAADNKELCPSYKLIRKNG